MGAVPLQAGPTAPLRSGRGGRRSRMDDDTRCDGVRGGRRRVVRLAAHLRGNAQRWLRHLTRRIHPAEPRDRRLRRGCGRLARARRRPVAWRRRRRDRTPVRRAQRRFRHRNPPNFSQERKIFSPRNLSHNGLRCGSTCRMVFWFMSERSMRSRVEFAVEWRSDFLGGKLPARVAAG